jgi:hypothetical protein
MDPVVKAEWVAALRSGDYRQGKLALRTENAEYCCLGVLCDLYAQKGEGEWAGQLFRFGPADANWDHEGSGVLPRNLARLIDLPGDNPTTSVRLDDGDGADEPASLAELNDNSYTPFSFNDIADVIERDF